EVAAESEEHFRLPVVHCLNGFDGVEAVIAWRFEIKLRAEPVQKRSGRPLPNPDCTVALNVAVTAHRTNSRARFADLPAQQHQVDDLLDVRDRVAMLRQTHGPAEDRAFRGAEDLRGFLD